MVNDSDMLLEEIEVLRNRMHELYQQTRNLKNQNLIKISKKIGSKTQYSSETNELVESCPLVE
jgi:hypothetical protein